MMTEPYLSEFRALLFAGAGAADVHDASPTGAFAVATPATEAFVAREVGRVASHQKHLVALLEAHVGRAEKILDVGCSTGGTTIALALSRGLAPSWVVGVDPNALSLEAARVRARGYADRTRGRVRFRAAAAGAPLPAEDGAFDLVVCVSVLEFVSSERGRRFLVDELKRVCAPGGHVFVATPRPAIFEHHSRRFLGDFRIEDGSPWSSPPSWLRRAFADFRTVPLHGYVLRAGLARLGLEKLPIPAAPFAWLPRLAPWQKLLARKPS